MQSRADIPLIRQSRVIALLAILCLVLTGLGRIPDVSAQATSGESGTDTGTSDAVNIDLEGMWRFSTGDDLAWAEPGFDDSAWEQVMVPAEGGQPIFADYDGYAWFRLTFDLPAGIAGTNLVASLGFIDDADVSYLNGIPIGGTGTLPPASDSQWFERRLYPVPADAPNFGGTNVLAVRMNDFSGGGGWYRGPVGLFSKSALREVVYGLTGPAADTATTTAVTDLLATQSTALADGDVEAYLATLAPSYVHDGFDRDRRASQIRSWLAESDTLTLTDAGVEVIAADDGRLVVDTNRAISGMRDGEPFAFVPEGQQFLVMDVATNGSSAQEVGNRSRFFRDLVESEVEDKRREYVVYLPPSYYTNPDHHFPTVYLLHGINGGSREWEPRDFGRRLDELFTTGGLAESIVIMPDGESLWYIDSSVTPWRSMFIEEMVPQVDTEYRTLPQREFRALSGVSMGGHGTFTVGWSNPTLFSSLATHMGALDFPPLVGTPAEILANTPETPVVQAGNLLPDFLDDFDYYFDACESDDFAFDDAARAMDGALTSKGIDHTVVIYPEGRHNDECWLPHIDASFGLHSDHFRAAGLVEPVPVPMAPDEPPVPTTPPAIDRVAGPGRVATSVALSRDTFEQADTVVLARADDFPDALSAGPLAILSDGPLLLSDRERLPPQVDAELDRLGTTMVYLAGGDAALSVAVEQAVRAKGITVRRLDGADRYATSAEVAREMQRLNGQLDGGILARGDAFADALAASSLASTGPYPILLTQTSSLPAVTREVMAQVLVASAPVTLAGGETAISADVERQVEAEGFAADRRGGANRYGTAAALREAAAARGADLDPLVVASGADFPDALGAGVVAARLGGGLLLVDPDDLDRSPDSASALDGLATSRVIVAGGSTAVSDMVLEQIRDRLAG